VDKQDKQTIFQLGNTAIDLGKVVAFLEVPRVADAPAASVSLLVHMVDGSNTVIYGDGDAKAFAQAMDSYLDVNPG
jgi:hypothetical protein